MVMSIIIRRPELRFECVGDLSRLSTRSLDGQECDSARGPTVRSLPNHFPRKFEKLATFVVREPPRGM